MTLALLINRRDDILLLFQHFLAQNEAELGAFARTWAIGLRLPEKTQYHAADGRPLHMTVAEFDRAVIENTLRAVGGIVFRLEQLLATPRKTLYDTLNGYGLRPKDYR
jgi:two-component system, NtrC family, C4-dicarboxylate transport response regulator DctD